MWTNGDGTSMFRVDCDDVCFIRLTSAANITVVPGLQAPADLHSNPVKAYFTKQGVKAEPGDTTLNMLRKLRDSKGMGHILIDSPF
jgi:hypothetical protein